MAALVSFQLSKVWTATFAFFISCSQVAAYQCSVLLYDNLSLYVCGFFSKGSVSVYPHIVQECFFLLRRHRLLPLLFPVLQRCGCGASKQTGYKLAKAEKLGIRIVYEEDFLEMIGGGALKNEMFQPVSVVESHHSEPVQLSLFE